MKLFKKHIYIIGGKPQTDWRRVLIASAVLALAFSVYGFVFYRQVSVSDRGTVESVVASDTSNSTSTIQSEGMGGTLELSQIIEFYSKKKEQFEKMVGELKK